MYLLFNISEESAIHGSFDLIVESNLEITNE